MSRNLVKGYFMTVQEDEKRIVHSNERMEERMAALKAQLEAENAVSPDGFSAGLAAERLAVDALLADPEDGDGASGNVIKAESGEELEAMRSRASEEAQAILSDARAQAESVLEDARAQAEQEKEQVLAQARDQGYRDGYEEGRQTADREAHKAMEQLQEREQELERSYQKRFDELEPQFIDVLTGIYEHIFHVELSSYREILVYLISNTIRKVEGGQGFLVHVSQEDYPYVSMQKKQLAGSVSSPNASLEIVEDISLAKNECLIETEGGIFDCGLGTQLSELGQKLKLLSYERS